MSAIIRFKKASIVLAAVALSYTYAEADFSPREVSAIDGNVRCFVRRGGELSTTTGPCDGFIPPARIMVGATFTANGKERTIGVITAMQVDEDIDTSGAEMRKGQWLCAAAETSADLGETRNALWLSIKQCRPMT
jgi:hypothetical protein